MRSEGTSGFNIMIDYLLLAVLAFAVAALALFALKKRKSSQQSMRSLAVEPLAEPIIETRIQELATEPALPAAIVFGQDLANPAVKITALSDDERFRAALPLDVGSSIFGRVNALFQAVPTLLIERAHEGKNLMEVVIDGDLIRAAGGNGFRAIAVDANGKFSEHARLFEPEKLQELVNTAAVWQIASVVVAQKHLADISEKLDQIVKGIKELSRFLTEERRSTITGTYAYLRQVVDAIRGGEISSAARQEIESCERDLLKVQVHLVAECRSRLSDEIKHTETFGTGRLTEDLKKRFESLGDLIADLRLCIKTRILAWHVLSLVPGEAQIKISRQRDIKRGIDELSKLEDEVRSVLRNDLARFTSKINREATLSERKDAITASAAKVQQSIEQTRDDCAADVGHSASMLLTHDQPITLIVEMLNGQLQEIRQAIPALRS